MERPTCKCGQPVAKNGKDLADGRGNWKHRCRDCHIDHFAGKKKLDKHQWVNINHPYLKNRKDYCENNYLNFWTKLTKKIGKPMRKDFAALSVGFICTSDIRIPALLDVDHIDGNHHNNNKKNHQTLCSNCHRFKTLAFGDGQKPR